MENAHDQVARLRAYIAALEAELASYVARYGLRDTARELLKRPVE